jgi:hypothetical protein
MQLSIKHWSLEMDGTTQVNFVSDVQQRQRHDFRSDFSSALQGAQAAMMNSLFASSGDGKAAQQDAPAQGTGAGALIWRQAQPSTVAEPSEKATDAELMANLAMIALLKMATDSISGPGDQQAGTPEDNDGATMPTNLADIPLFAPTSMPPSSGMDGGSAQQEGPGRMRGLSKAVESTGGAEGGRHGGSIVQTIRELVEEGKRGREFGAAVSGVARSRGAEASQGRAGGAAASGGMGEEADGGAGGAGGISGVGGGGMRGGGGGGAGGIGGAGGGGMRGGR